MSGLIVAMEKALLAGKYCLMLDKTERAHVYFNHKATTKDFHKEVVSQKIGKKTKEQCLEVLRRGIVYAMRTGDIFCINVDRVTPDFRSVYTSETFPCQKVFNYEEFHRMANYMELVRPDENTDLYGNKGMFSMQRSFKLVILATYTDEAAAQKLRESIPGIENFQEIIVEKDEAIGEVGAASYELRKAKTEIVKKKAAFISYDHEMEKQMDFYDKWIEPSHRKGHGKLDEEGRPLDFNVKPNGCHEGPRPRGMH